jgi:hypothetical protein
MAPAWYVLALSLVGLGLGLWLRQTYSAPEKASLMTR